MERQSKPRKAVWLKTKTSLKCTLNRYARFDELVKEKKPRLDDENSPTNWSQLFKRVFARVRQEIVFTFRGLNLLKQLILRSRIADDDKRVMKHTFWFELTIALGQLAILLIYLLSKPQRSSLLILTAICTIAVLVSNTVVAMLHTYHPRQAVMASAICALVILGVANQYSPLPRGIMSLYGFGENTKFTFFLNDDGTKLIERFGLANQACSDGPSNPGRLCNVQVLSALGNDYYLKIGNVNITVPKSMVVARKTEKPTE